MKKNIVLILIVALFLSSWFGLVSVTAQEASAEGEDIRKPLRAYPMGTIMSEGVDVINADKVHEVGIRGEDVKIAIIDTGFKAYKSNPEIPAENIEVNKSFRADGKIDISEHGTACAEVVLDVAPNAKLYLFAAETGVEFVNAVDYAISQGVDIISCSLGFYNAGGYDGTGFICDAVDKARDKGILFVTAAGDEAGRHYEGKYKDTDGDAWHEFNDSSSPRDEILNLTIEKVPYGTTIGLFLSWDDWPTSNQDYDLYLYEKNDTTGIWEEIDSSKNPQTGFQPPTESIVHKKSHGSTSLWGVLIRKYSATRAVNFELYCDCSNVSFAEYNVERSSLTIPADAEGAMIVGATYWKTDDLESFSSRGPTNDGRTKPDVTAPDGVSNFVYGKFYGTSVSVAHTAGAAALLVSAKPSLTSDALQSLLEDNAVDLGAYGKDNLYGSGRIDVWEAYQSIVPTPETTVNITPPAQTVRTGLNFIINITVDPAVPIAGVQLNLSFNSSLLQTNSVTEGNLLKQEGAGTYFNPGAIDNTAGTIAGIAGTITTPEETVSLPGVFATINMSAKSVEGTSTLDLSNVIVGDIKGIPVSIRVNGGGVTIVTNPWDVNGDGHVNVLDMIRVGQHFGDTGPPGWILEDVNRDGHVNVLDMILIGQHWTG